MKGFADLQIRNTFVLLLNLRKLVISQRSFLFEQTLADLAISFILKNTVHKRCFADLANVAGFCSST